MKNNFYEAIENRRSIYGLGNHEAVSEEKIVSLVNHMVKYCPSAFNSQSSGMLQYMVWAALENEGAGASLQHYNPLIDDAVAAEWKLPASWKLISQMPVGSREAPAGEKTFESIEKRVKVFK